VTSAFWGVVVAMCWWRYDATHRAINSQEHKGVSLPKTLLRKYKRRSEIFGGIYFVLFMAAFIPSLKTFNTQQRIFSEQKTLWPRQAAVGNAVLAL